MIVCTDSERLFAPNPSSPSVLMVTTRQGYPFSIPCRPTHPDVVMALWKGHSSATGTTQIHTGHDVTYHPHTGFYVRTPNTFYNGGFHCEARFNDTRKFFDFIMIFWRELPIYYFFTNYAVWSRWCFLQGCGVESLGVWVKGNVEVDSQYRSEKVQEICTGLQ